MSPAAEAANIEAFNKAKAKSDAKFRVAMNKVKLLRDRADAMERAARDEQSEAFKAAMAAGRKAQWAVERKEA